MKLAPSSLTFELEAQMTEPATALARRWWGRAALDVVAREVVTPGAIADLVGCAFDRRRFELRCDRDQSPILQWAPLACVSACEEPLTTGELARAVGLSVSAVRKAVAFGVAHGALDRDGLLVSRNPKWHPPVRRLAAIELKLTDWRKALRQAETYVGWADETWVVMGRATSTDLYDAAEALGIGVAFLNAGTLIVAQRPARRKHSAFAVARLLAGEQAFAQALAGVAKEATARDRGAAQPAFVC